MQHKDDLMAELLLRLCRELSFPANAYRLILPKYPLSTNGPSHSDCASAGSYVVGRRMEAERLHRILYTALHPKATAVEIMDPSSRPVLPQRNGNPGPRGGQEPPLPALQDHRPLEVRLDLTQLPSKALRPFVHPYSAQRASCRLRPKTTLTQRVGRRALLEGFYGIVRPSAAFWCRWEEGREQRPFSTSSAQTRHFPGSWPHQPTRRFGGTHSLAFALQPPPRGDITAT